MAILKLSAPWMTYYKELNELFKRDPQVKVVYDDENREVTLYVDDAEKADAITQLLPTEVEFGNVTLKVFVVPANKLLKSKGTDFEKAFKDNPAVSYTETIRTIFGDDITFVVFKKEVVQYFNDDLFDVNGLCSTLYQDIAKRVFKDVDGVRFCTDNKSSVVISTGTCSFVSK